jgi:hypothetical protein
MKFQGVEPMKLETSLTPDSPRCDLIGISHPSLVSHPAGFCIGTGKRSEADVVTKRPSVLESKNKPLLKLYIYSIQHTLRYILTEYIPSPLF